MLTGILGSSSQPTKRQSSGRSGLHLLGLQAADPAGAGPGRGLGWTPRGPGGPARRRTPLLPPRGGGLARARPGRGGAGDPGPARGREPEVHTRARVMELTEPHRRPSHAGGARPGPPPPPPDPPLLRQKDRQGFPTCRALHVHSLSCLVKNGGGWRAGLRGRRRRGAGRTPLRRLRAPAPGRRRQVTKW